jgi:hypothetical protein
MAKPGTPASFRKTLEDQEKTMIRPAITRCATPCSRRALPAAREAIGVNANERRGLLAAVKYHATVSMTRRKSMTSARRRWKITAEMKTIGSAVSIPPIRGAAKLVTTDPKCASRAGTN